MKKKCSKCKQNVCTTEFNREKRNKDGLRSECKLCHYKSQQKSITKKIELMEKQNG